MKKLKTYKVKAFTLIEMLVVLLIISVLLLLFVPNLTKQKDSVKETGNAAVVKVVESQAELYELHHTNDQATLSKLIAFIYLGLSGSIKTSFQQVEEKVFFAEFEHLYQESQKIALARQTELDVEVTARKIQTPYQTVEIPDSIILQDPKTIRLDRAGGNSSLANVHFQTQRGVVTYQLSLGNGKIKKSIRSR